MSARGGSAGHADGSRSPASVRGVAVLRAVGFALTRLPRVAGLLLAAGWIVVIWNLSGIEGTDGARAFWRAWLHNSAHAPLFGLLAFLFAIALPRERRWPRVDARGGALVMAAVLAYSLVDEWHQSRIPGRDADGADTLTDLVGAAVTLWTIRWLGRDEAARGGLWPRIVLGLALCFAAGLVATLRSWT